MPQKASHCQSFSPPGKCPRERWSSYPKLHSGLALSKSQIFKARAAHETTALDFWDGASHQHRSRCCKDCWHPQATGLSASLLPASALGKTKRPQQKLLVPSKIQHFLFLSHQTQQLYDKFAEEKPKGVKKLKAGREAPGMRKEKKRSQEPHPQ